MVTHGTKGTVSEVKLYYTKNNGTTWKVIKTLTGNAGIYRWSVPSVTSSTCKVKVVLLSGSGAVIGSDVSDASFPIGP